MHGAVVLNAPPAKQVSKTLHQLPGCAKAERERQIKGATETPGDLAIPDLPSNHHPPATPNQHPLETARRPCLFGVLTLLGAANLGDQRRVVNRRQVRQGWVPLGDLLVALVQRGHGVVHNQRQAAKHDRA